MNSFEKEQDKILMLEKMKEDFWETKTNEDSSYEEVERDFNEMIIAHEADEREMGIEEDV
uniref:hypothetical protein n=1 Tax=Clostridium sp. 12(A) TaxID=1163671 RepID=UPI0004AED927|nr:hypothetical protein [Clostridium sp. 12(A)]